MTRIAALAALVLLVASFVPRSSTSTRPSSFATLDDCVAPTTPRAESLIIDGRFWHASRMLPPLRAAPRALPVDSALLRAAIAEGLSRFRDVEDLLDRVRGGDTIPAFLIMAARADERAERWRPAELKYRRVLALEPSRPEIRVAAPRLAVVFERQGLRDSAIAAWRRAAQAVPELADWFALRRGMLEPDTAVAFATVSGARTPGALRSSLLFIAQRRQVAGDLLGALDLFDRLGRPLDIARVEFALGKVRQARQRADSILFRDASNVLNPNAFLAATFLTERFDTLSLAENIAVSRAYWARGDRFSAEQYARAAVLRGRAMRPDTSVEAWLELAKVQSERRNLPAALHWIDSAGVRAGRRRGGMIGAARVQALAAVELWDDAARMLDDLAKVQGGDTSVARSILFFADRNRARGETDPERARYSLLLRRFPEAPATIAARLRLGLVAYMLGRKDSALVLVSGAARRDSLRTLGLAPRYWQARLRYESGDSMAASELRRIGNEFPLAFYGVRARELLGDTTFVSDTVIQMPRPGSFAPARARERVRLLAMLGLDPEARAEATGWAVDTSASPYVLMAAAQAAADAGYARESITLGDALRQRVGMTTGTARALFPLAWRGVIDSEAAELCIDPLLMAALIRQESRFDPRAVSKVGARGIGQVMPATGQQYATRLKLGPWDGELLFVPDFNLHLGARYVRDRMDHDSFPVYALLASYNAGPARVGRWKLWPEYGDPDLFAERVSIAETRDYVRTVYASYAWYHSAWKSSATAPAERPASLVP